MDDGPTAMDVQSYAIAASWTDFVALDISLAADIIIDSKTRISPESQDLIGWSTHGACLMNLLLCDVIYKNNSLV